MLRRGSSSKYESRPFGRELGPDERGGGGGESGNFPRGEKDVTEKGEGGERSLWVSLKKKVTFAMPFVKRKRKLV